MIQRKVVHDDIISYASYIVGSMQSHAMSNEQELSLTSNRETFLMDYDENHFETILVNLISNAVKYSDRAGRIRVDMVIEDEKVTIHVSDTGVGIAADQLDRIFDRYYRISDGRSDEVGSGIGLALTKELVEKSGGNISVESTLGKGSVFSVRLPVTHDATKQATVHSDLVPGKNGTRQPVTDKPEVTVLLVEDNPDVAEYVQACLAPEYHCVHAINGKEGLEKALEIMPDLIVSDVMMPRMTGTEMVKLLRSDERVDHIPVIMLTAKVELEDRIAGIEHGADIYLGKPFEERELLAHVQHLIEQRKKLMIRFAQGKEQSPVNDPIADKNADYLTGMEQIILDYLDDATFGVEELAREVNLSPRQLARKLKAISSLTASQLIKRVRIEEAKKLLLNTSQTITEVAFAVGYSSSQYFATVFKNQVGASPGDFVQSHQLAQKS